MRRGLPLAPRRAELPTTDHADSPSARASVHPLSVQSSEVLLPPGYGQLLLSYVLLAYEARITTVSLCLRHALA